jgi:hypothetical protein
MRTGLEKVLINLDIGALGALLRVLLGALLVPAVELAHPQAGPWLLSASLLLLLFAVKVFSALARRRVSASAEVRSHWEWRRKLARHYDSYQWRKLLWIGAGIMISAALGWPGTRAQWVLGAVCTAAGGVGEIAWRRHRLSLAPSTP